MYIQQILLLLSSFCIFYLIWQLTRLRKKVERLEAAKAVSEIVKADPEETEKEYVELHVTPLEFLKSIKNAHVASLVEDLTDEGLMLVLKEPDGSIDKIIYAPPTCELFDDYVPFYQEVNRLMGMGYKERKDATIRFGDEFFHD